MAQAPQKGRKETPAALRLKRSSSQYGAKTIGFHAQVLAAHPAVSRATTGVAESINRMQDKARALAKK